MSPLGLQLARDESDRHDAVLLRRVQQPLAGALAGGIVLEGDLVEPGQRIPHVGLIVDRKSPPAARIDVGEGPVRQAGSLARLEPRHARTITLLPSVTPRRVGGLCETFFSRCDGVTLPP